MQAEWGSRSSTLENTALAIDIASLRLQGSSKKRLFLAMKCCLAKLL